MALARQPRSRQPRARQPNDGCKRGDRAPAKAAEPFVRPGTPGAYMRWCRERAGLSIADCVRILCRKGAARGSWLTDKLIAMEADTPGDYGALLRLLRQQRPFSFSMRAWLDLAAQTNQPFLEEAAR